jgi:hypothetical protein
LSISAVSYSGCRCARAAASGSITVPPGVVDQHQDMGQLELGAFAHLQARRDALDDGAFRRPDQALAAGSVVVVLEVQLQHQAAPHAAVGKPALDQHQAIMAAQPALRQATAHRFVDALDPKRLVVGGQVDLGEDHVQRRRRVADLAGHSRPVRRLAGVLVAGDHAPAGEVQPLAGQQQARGAKTGNRVHGAR